MHVRLPRPARPLSGLAHRALVARGVALGPAFWLLAHGANTPGLGVHRRCAALGLRLLARGGWPRGAALQYVAAPMDSVRYFEFDFAWRVLTRGAAPRRYLDVASPRLLPALLLDRFPDARADLLNPDAADLAVTRRLVAAQGHAERCRFHGCLMGDAPFAADSFDTVTCISVLEHIPDDADALRAMWRALAPGGRLVLSVPCAASGYDEYVDYNEYGLLEPDATGFVFGQRFYDEASLAERVFAVVGAPAASSVFGERRRGAFAADRDRKLRDPAYPFYREPYTVGRDYTAFARVGDLPGIGVVAMCFVKP